MWVRSTMPLGLGPPEITLYGWPSSRTAASNSSCAAVSSMPEAEELAHTATPWPGSPFKKSRRFE